VDTSTWGHDRHRVARVPDFNPYHDRAWVIAARPETEGYISTELELNDTFPSDRITEIVRQLGSGLAALHERGITHRDLKLESGLIRSVDPLQLVLTDLGSAVTSTIRWCSPPPPAPAGCILGGDARDELLACE
jgi:serine/threonine protein kinase